MKIALYGKDEQTLDYLQNICIRKLSLEMEKIHWEYVDKIKQKMDIDLLVADAECLLKYYGEEFQKGLNGEVPILIIPKIEIKKQYHWIEIRVDGRKKKVPSCNILYVEAMDHYSKIYLSDGSVHIGESMACLEKRICKDIQIESFYRTSCFFLINLTRVMRLDGKNGYWIMMNGFKVKIPRRNIKYARDAYERYMGNKPICE